MAAVPRPGWGTKGNGHAPNVGARSRCTLCAHRKDATMFDWLVNPNGESGMAKCEDWRLVGGQAPYLGGRLLSASGAERFIP